MQCVRVFLLVASSASHFQVSHGALWSPAVWSPLPHRIQQTISICLLMFSWLRRSIVFLFGHHPLLRRTSFHLTPIFLPCVNGPLLRGM